MVQKRKASGGSSPHPKRMQKETVLDHNGKPDYLSSIEKH